MQPRKKEVGLKNYKHVQHENEIFSKLKDVQTKNVNKLNK